MFPTIRTLGDVLPAIHDRPEFVVSRQGRVTRADYRYLLADTFTPSDIPRVSPAQVAIRLECRGLKFDTATGELLGRPYHNFFNRGERPETQDSAIPWSEPHHVLEKIAGSMVHPIQIEEAVIWMTRMGKTDTATAAAGYVQTHPEYDRAAREALAGRWTPIFEWISPRWQVVLPYRRDDLILSAIRRQIDGAYLPPRACHRPTCGECRSYTRGGAKSRTSGHSCATRRPSRTARDSWSGFPAASW